MLQYVFMYGICDDDDADDDDMMMIWMMMMMMMMTIKIDIRSGRVGDFALKMENVLNANAEWGLRERIKDESQLGWVGLDKLNHMDYGGMVGRKPKGKCGGISRLFVSRIHPRREERTGRSLSLLHAASWYVRVFACLRVCVCVLVFFGLCVAVAMRYDMCGVAVSMGWFRAWLEWAGG
jgi:hypothetical protein